MLSTILQMSNICFILSSSLNFCSLLISDNETEMFVTWVTIDVAKGSIVEYGSKEGGVMDKVSVGYVTVFEDSGYERRTLQIHRATMKDLVPGREYSQL